MLIQNNILQKIIEEPLIFAEILRRYNLGNSSLKPETLKRRLDRKSAEVKSSVIIADYFREKGYADDQIFETEKETK